MARKTTEDRQEQICDAVIQIISEEGIDKLSMPAVAKKINVVPSAIYRHFNNKEEMVISAIGSLKNRALKLICGDYSNADIFEPFRNMLYLSQSFMPITSVFPKIVFGLPADPGQDLRRATLRKFLESIVSQYEKILVSGQERGDIRNDINVQSAAFHFCSSYRSSSVP